MISKYFTRRKPRIHKEFKQDSQAHLVYRMERDIIGWCVDSTVPTPKLRELARNACRRWGVIAPEIVIINKPKSPVFGWSDHEITLNKGYYGCNYAVLLHELAHWIIDQKGIEGEPHGPDWVRVYAELLEWYKFMPMDCFYLLCDKYGVKH